MRVVTLVRLDSFLREEFHVSANETVIGRGPILGCDDKRVSRNHCVLKLSEDGSITLCAIHTNPCFYKLQNDNSYSVLAKGQEKKLTFLDEFALLPDTFRYRITVKSELDNGNNNFVDSVAGVAVVSNGGATVIGSVCEDTAGDALITSRNPIVVDALVSPTKGADGASSFSSSVVNHKRNLPAWLTSLPHLTHAPKPLDKNTKRKLQRRRSESHTEKKLKRNTRISNANENNPTSSTTIEQDVVPESSVVGTATATGAVSSLHQLSDEDTTSKDAKDGYEAEYGDSSSNVNEVRVPTVGDAGSDSVESGPNQGTSTSRESCLYGKDCYRKNPQHRIDFSHPGDSDFKVANDNDLPECEYGTSCYRKNIQHRKDFKHTKPWKRPRPQPPSTTTAKDGESSEDDYDYDDPFLNDASSDDYRPTSSSESEVESDDDNGDTDYQDSPVKKKKRRKKNGD